MDVNPKTPGYTRLKFFRISLWQIIGLSLIVGIVAVLVFPRNEKLIAFYMSRGMPDKALEVISQMRAGHPRDIGLLMTAVSLYEQTGASEKALGLLETALGTHPRNPEIISRIATYYEQREEIADAVRMWEQLVACGSASVPILKKLLAYYQRNGPEKKRNRIIALLAWQEREMPLGAIFGEISDPALRDRMSHAPLLRAISAEIRRLTPAAPSEPADGLLCGLYIFRMNLVHEMARHPSAPDPTSTGCLEIYIGMGRLAEARAFAAGLDRATDGIMHRLSLVRVMRWHGAEARALALLSDIYGEYGQDTAVLLEIARISRARGDLENAIDAYERLVRIRPRDPVYRQTLAGLWLESEQPAKAYAVYKALAEDFGPDEELVGKILTVAAYTGDSARMAEAARLALAAFPTVLPVLRRVAKLFLWANRPERAYPILKEVAERSDGSAEAVAMIQTAELTGDPGLMREAALTGRILRPHDPALLQRAARLLVSAGDPAEAIATYLACTALRPGDANARRELARLYLWQETPLKAYGVYRKIVPHLSQSREDADRLMEIAGFTGKPDIVLEAVRVASQLFPRDTPLCLRNAELLLALGRHPKAIGAYRAYLKLKPRDHEARQQLARLCLWTNRPQEALKLLKRLSDEAPSDFPKALAAGNAAVAAGALKTGVRYLERAVRLRPERFSLRKKLAQYYGWAGQTRKMIAELEYLDTQEAIAGPMRLTLARAYLDREAGHKALRHLVRYEKEERLPPQAGLMLARAYELTGKTDSAVRIFERLGKENGSDADLLSRLGDYALWLQHIDIAAGFYRSALKRDPKNLTALKGSAQLHAWNNNPQKAMALFETYNRLNPNDYSARYQLGELYFVNDRKGDAFKEYRKALRLIKQVKALRESGTGQRAGKPRPLVSGRPQISPGKPVCGRRPGP